MRRLPDWLVYVAVFATIIFALYRADQRADAPPAPPESAVIEGPLLPGPSVFDPEVLVQVGPVSSGVGTAFAIDANGWWLTARHVVDACEKVGIVIGNGSAVSVKDIRLSRFADLALLHTNRAPDPLALALDDGRFRVGQTAFHMGYPQGKPGEAVSRLMGREKLIAHGRYNLEEPVLAWAEIGRTQGLFGTLAGMSGGPVFDQHGRVIGITVAESSRRGRLYTASPSSIKALLNVQQLTPSGAPAGPLTMRNYGPEADRLRRGLSVAQIVCVAPGA